MTDITQRIINALRRAVISARNADEATEAAYLADSLESMIVAYSGLTVIPPQPDVLPPLKGGTPVDPATIPEPPPVDNAHVAPGAEPFAHLPLTPEQAQAAQELAPPASAVEQKS